MVSSVGVPQFGGLTQASHARGPMATNNFQNIEFNFMDNLQGPKQGGGGPKLTADVAADYAGIRAGMDQDTSGMNPIQKGIRFISNMIVGNKLANAQK